MVKRKLPPELENWLFLHYSDKTNKELAAELNEMLKRENQKQLERLYLLLEEDFCDNTKKVIQRQIDAILEFKGISESSVKRYAHVHHFPKKSRKHIVYCYQGKARATNIKRWLKKAEKVEHIMEWLRTFDLKSNRCCIVEDEGKLKSMKVSINKYNRYEGYEQGILLAYEYIPEVCLLRVYATPYR
jgi:hypothetical protein